MAHVDEPSARSCVCRGKWTPRAALETALLTCSAKSHLRDRCRSGAILLSSEVASRVQVTCCTNMKKIGWSPEVSVYSKAQDVCRRTAGFERLTIYNANAGRILGKPLAVVTGAFCLSCVKVLVITALLLWQARRAACDNLGSGAPYPRRINITLYAPNRDHIILVHHSLLQSHLYGPNHSLFSTSSLHGEGNVSDFCYRITSLL